MSYVVENGVYIYFSLWSLFHFGVLIIADVVKPALVVHSQFSHCPTQRCGVAAGAAGAAIADIHTSSRQNESFGQAEGHEALEAAPAAAAA